MVIDERAADQVDFKTISVKYDGRTVLSELNRRAVPDREFIRKTFFGDV